MVSQTFGSLSSMRAGGIYFYYWHMFLMNIINYAGVRVQYLQQNLCEVGRIIYYINSRILCVCVCVCVCVCLQFPRYQELEVVALHCLHQRAELHLASYNNCF